MEVKFQIGQVYTASKNQPCCIPMAKDGKVKVTAVRRDGVECEVQVLTTLDDGSLEHGWVMSTYAVKEGIFTLDVSTPPPFLNVLKFKKLHPDAKVPAYAKPGDAGLDLTCVSHEWDPVTGTFLYKTGLAVEIPEGHVGLIFPRSSIFNYRLSLTNSVGVIDSGYRGEICARFRAAPDVRPVYENGERIMQMIVMPYPKFVCQEVDELSTTERGATGFGSSGKT